MNYDTILSAIALYIVILKIVRASSKHIHIIHHCYYFGVHIMMLMINESLSGISICVN
jgi:hypothetical protein